MAFKIGKLLLMKARNSGYKSIVELEKLKALDLRQKSRIKWAIDGDENMRFFHGHIYNNNRKSMIVGLLINGEWYTDTIAIKQEVYSFFFSKKYKEKYRVKPKLNIHHFKKFSCDERQHLESPISLCEI